MKKQKRANGSSNESGTAKRGPIPLRKTGTTETIIMIEMIWWNSANCTHLFGNGEKIGNTQGYMSATSLIH